MGLEQVAVLDPLVAGEGLAGGEKGLGRVSLRRQRFLVPVLVPQVIIRRQTRPGLFVSDDRRPRLPEGQVPAHLLPVPVRVEHSLDLACARQLAQAGKHRVGEFGGAAVHQHLTGARRPHQDIAPGAGEHDETIAHRDDGGALLGETVAREGRQGQTHDAA